MHKQKTALLLSVSWGTYIANQFLQIQLTDAKFDLAFPILNWQLLFFNGMAIGYRRKTIAAYSKTITSPQVIVFAGLFCMAFMFLTFNRPNLIFWLMDNLSYIKPEHFQVIYNLGFQKGSSGIGRVINIAALFIIAYSLLSRYWHLFNKSIGWLLIPIGQASLYVFIVHVYFVLLISNIPIADYNNIYLTTPLVHAGAILAIWWMVKNQIFFKLIPR